MKKIGIIGKTNVGKSTLFNRLVGKEKSIVSSVAGTTRDYVSGKIIIGNDTLELFDFGGFDFSTNLEIERSVQKKVLSSIQKMDLLLFVVDGRSGISIEDQRATEIVRKSKKPAILVVNKIDSPKQDDLIFDFYKLGFDDIVSISASNNLNLLDLVEKIGKKMGFRKSKKKIAEEEELPRIAIIGKPNVGKSSLFNALCGEERSIVTEIAGTTRDSIDAEVLLDKDRFIFIDTAGLRRKSKISEDLDQKSSIRSIKAINRSDVILYVLDVNNFATEYDIKLINYAWKKGKDIIVAVNKWDIKQPDMTELKYKNILSNDYSIFNDLCFVFVSSVKKTGIDKLASEIKRIRDIQSMKIKTSQLNQEIRKVLSEFGRSRGRFFYATQIGQKPMEIILFVNSKKDFNKSYIDYVEKGLRKRFGLFGSPLNIVTRER